jgi:hypothetical protein
MMPQKEVSEAMHEQAGPAYGRYEGNHAHLPAGISMRIPWVD